MGPNQRTELDWVDAEFANLRTAFRWAHQRGDLATATTIASHAAIMIWPLQRFEPVSWALEILDSVVEAEVPQLPRLYVAASLCLYLGEPDLAVTYAETATTLRDDVRYDAFEEGWSEMLESLANLFGGRIERRIEISTDLAERTGFAVGSSASVGSHGRSRPSAGRTRRSRSPMRPLTRRALYGNPFWIGWALGGYGRAYANSAPDRALGALREGLAFARENRLGFWEANLAQDAAQLEASHGELGDAMALFSTSIDSFHRAGNIVFLAATLASLAVFLDRLGRVEVAAVVYGASTRQPSIGLVPSLGLATADLRSVLGDEEFEELVARGAAHETAEAVRFAQLEIERVIQDMEPVPE